MKLEASDRFVVVFERDHLWAVVYFSVVAAVVSSIAVAWLSALFVTKIGMLATVAFATGAAALAAWTLRHPLARAKGGSQAGRGALLGAAVALIAYAGFAAVFSVAYNWIAGMPVLLVAALVLMIGAYASLLLLSVGALTGIFYVRKASFVQ